MTSKTPAPAGQAPTTPAPVLVSPIVSTQWLADHLGSEHLIVLDASTIVLHGQDGALRYLSGYDQYLFDGHIPGAVFADLVEAFSDPAGPHGFTRPTAGRFAEGAIAAGVTAAHTVVVYDSSYGQFASRLWWLFRSLGHESVAVLDGGFTKWRAESRPVDGGHVEPAPGSFVPLEQPGRWAEKADVEAVVAGTEHAALLSGVPPREFTGESVVRARAGHIPGSLSVPAGRLIDRATNTFLPVARLRELFAPVLETAGPGGRIIAYCGGGVASAADALALELIGVTDVAVYDGSLNEWASDPAAPLVTTWTVDAGRRPSTGGSDDGSVGRPGGSAHG